MKIQTLFVLMIMSSMLAVSVFGIDEEVNFPDLNLSCDASHGFRDRKDLGEVSTCTNLTDGTVKIYPDICEGTVLHKYPMTPFDKFNCEINNANCVDHPTGAQCECKTGFSPNEGGDCYPIICNSTQGYRDHPFLGEIETCTYTATQEVIVSPDYCDGNTVHKYTAQPNHAIYNCEQLFNGICVDDPQGAHCDCEEGFITREETGYVCVQEGQIPEFSTGLIGIAVAGAGASFLLLRKKR